MLSNVSWLEFILEWNCDIEGMGICLETDTPRCRECLKYGDYFFSLMILLSSITMIKPANSGMQIRINSVIPTLFS